MSNAISQHADNSAPSDSVTEAIRNGSVITRTHFYLRNHSELCTVEHLIKQAKTVRFTTRLVGKRHNINVGKRQATLMVREALQSYEALVSINSGECVRCAEAVTIDNGETLIFG